MQQIDQGSIIYGLRSDKYPEKACMGIVISARCDIANRKIKKLYYLTALQVKDWLISDVGFETATKSICQSTLKAFKNEAEKHGLNVDVLLSLDEADFEVVIEQEITKKKERDLIRDKYKQYIHICGADEAERSAIIGKEKKNIKQFLIDVNAGANAHLYYMPAFAYREDAEKHEGLIVDLQEIGTLRIVDAQSICDNEVDGKTLSPERRAYFSQFCWIEGEDDFSIIDGLIPSPWCEHLLQRFANGFTRIGVDGPTKDDFETIVECIVEEET